MLIYYLTLKGQLIGDMSTDKHKILAKRDHLRTKLDSFGSLYAHDIRSAISYNVAFLPTEEAQHAIESSCTWCKDPECHCCCCDDCVERELDADQSKRDGGA